MEIATLFGWLIVYQIYIIPGVIILFGLALLKYILFDWSMIKRQVE